MSMITIATLINVAELENQNILCIGTVLLPDTAIFKTQAHGPLFELCAVNDDDNDDNGNAFRLWGAVDSMQYIYIKEPLTLQALISFKITYGIDFFIDLYSYLPTM